MLTMYPKTKSQSAATFTTHRKFSFSECGQHKGLRVVASTSRRDPAKTKLWVYKPLSNTYFPDDGYAETFYRRLMSLTCRSYDLKKAAREAFCGRLATRIFGKDRAPDTKFMICDEPKHRGVISRIIGDDESICMNMYKFASMFPAVNNISNITHDAHLSLLDAILYRIITGSRDLHSRNMIVKCERKADGSYNGVMIYGVDHEYAFENGYFTRCMRSLHSVNLNNMLSKFYSQPSSILESIFQTISSSGIMDKKYIMSRLSLEPWIITRSLYIQALERIVDAISNIDFKICQETKDYISAKLKANGSVYAADEIEQIVEATIEDAILMLRENVSVVSEFLMSVQNHDDVRNSAYTRKFGMKSV